MVGICATGCATAENDYVTPPIPDAPPSEDAPVTPDAQADASPDSQADAVADATGDASPDASPDAPQGNACEIAPDITSAAKQPGGTTVTGDTSDSVDNVTTPSACTGYAADGEDDVYKIVVVAGDRVSVTMQPTTDWDASVSLVGGCGEVECLIGRDVGFGGDPETFVYNFTAAGTFYVVADGYNPGTNGPYSLTVVITHP